LNSKEKPFKDLISLKGSFYKDFSNPKFGYYSNADGENKID